MPGESEEEAQARLNRAVSAQVRAPLTPATAVVPLSQLFVLCCLQQRLDQKQPKKTMAAHKQNAKLVRVFNLPSRPAVCCQEVHGLVVSRCLTGSHARVW